MHGEEAAHLSHSTEYALIGTAIAIAVAGIAFAWTRLKPEVLVPAKDSPAEVGIEKTLLNKWYVDEAYATTVVKPTLGISRNLLWKGIDTGIIDGLLVNGSAVVTRFAGWCGSQLQSGPPAWGRTPGAAAGRAVRALRLLLPLRP